MGNKTGFEVYGVIVWSQNREPFCSLFFKDTAEVMEIVWQELLEVDWIILGGVPCCEFLSWVGGTDSDWIE